MTVPPALNLKVGFLLLKKKIKQDFELSKILQNLENEKQFLWDHLNRHKKYFNHLCSNLIIKYAIANNCGLIIFGKNSEMKQNMNNVPLWQKISHSKIMNLVLSKCQDFDIVVDFQDESYTSKTSFFDNESFEHDSKRTGIRSGRFFIRANGRRYDADVHACLNIYKKYILSNGLPFDFNNFVRIRVQDSRNLNLFDSGLKNFRCFLPDFVVI